VTISSLLPSRTTALENRSLLIRALTDSAKNSLIDLGFDPSVIVQLDSAVRNSQLVNLEQFFDSPVSKPWRSLIIPQKKGVASIILLKDVRNSKVMSQAVSSDNSQYVDRVEEISTVLGKYRYKSTQLLGIAYCIILVLMIIRYGIRKGIRVCLAPILAGSAVIGALSLAGESITFMHIMALLLVLGIGIDYTIFFAESSDHDNQTTIAVILSALSTIFAFGVLFVSTTPALRAIGLVITPGIALSVLLAMLFKKNS